jgi:eukaryotic-like serine/threonine-protein kinase
MSDDLDTLLGKLAATPRQRTPLHFVGTKRFELLRQLGSGGFGDVYEARDREHNTKVALKALKSSNPDWIYRFKREFRLVGDLAHPNLVRLFELFVEGDRWYLTMELIDGLRFDAFIARAPDQLRASFLQLALGVTELHRARCLHRDLKPSNALVEPTGRVVLLDFGLAVHQRATRTSAVAGTPIYMAPEVGLGAPPSEASDWYGFGVMLYEALAGKVPYPSNEVASLQHKLAAPPPLPSLIRSDVDPALEALAMRLLDKDPRKRATGEDVLRELLGDASGPVSRWRGVAPGQLLVGRERELARLVEARMAAQHAATVVIVKGLPGIGKSSLVGAFLDRLRDANLRVQAYQGRCLELESVPFKGLDGAIDMMCNDLSRRRYDEAQRLAPQAVGALVKMFPMLKRVEAFARARAADTFVRTPQRARDAASHALRELIANLAEEGTVILFVDDLQWASDDSVQLLLELLSAPRAPHMLLIVAHRSGETPVVERFNRGITERGVVPIVIDVPPLDRDAIEQWIGKHSADATNRVTTEQALRETAGHPQLLARLLELGSQGGARQVDLTAVVAAELAQLDSHARALVDVISVAGGPIRQQAAFDAAGLTRDPATIDQLRRRKLIQGGTSDVHVETYHDRVREIALATLPDARRRQLHLALAHALERSDLVEPDVLARHYREAGDDAGALRWTLRAAEHATTTLAFARAVELYYAAVELATPDQQIDVLGQLAEAQVLRGLRADAAQTCLDAAAIAARLGRTSEQAALRAKAGEHWLLAGQLDRGLELLRDALAEVGVVLPASAAVAVAESFNVGGALSARGLALGPRRDDPRLVQRLDLELAVARSLTQTDLRAPLMAARGLADALQLGEPSRIQRALSLFVLNHAARAPDDPLLADAATRAYSLAEQLADDVGLAWGAIANGFLAIYRQELATALSWCDEAERRFLALPGYGREVALAQLAIVVVCGNYVVDLEHARRRLTGFTDEMLALGDLFSATWGRFVQILNELAAGNVKLARSLIETVQMTWPNAKDSLMSASLLLHQIALDLYEDPATAWDAMCAIEPELHQMFSSMIPITIQHHARLSTNCAVAAFAARRATRQQTLARIDAVLERLVHLPRRGVTLLCEGHRLLIAGDLVGSLDARTQAADFWRSSHQYPFEHAVRLRICELRGDRDGARRTAQELRRLGIGDPARYATVIAGPIPPT